MSDTFAEFEARLNNLERKHKELAKGYVAQINPDGLITIQPKQSRGIFGLRFIAALFLGFVLFKIITLAVVGPMTYDTRLEAMREGTGPERISAWIMQADPLSEAAAKYIISLAPGALR